MDVSCEKFGLQDGGGITSRQDKEASMKSRTDLENSGERERKRAIYSLSLGFKLGRRNKMAWKICRGCCYRVVSHMEQMGRETRFDVDKCLLLSMTVTQTGIPASNRRRRMRGGPIGRARECSRETATSPPPHLRPRAAGSASALLAQGEAIDTLTDRTLPSRRCHHVVGGLGLR